MEETNKFRFTEIWTESRHDAGMSQETLASIIGVSKRTIQNWESGASSPSIQEGFEWFKALGINPLRYYLKYLYPHFFDDESGAKDEQVEDTLIAYIKNCTPKEQKQLLFTLTGPHGSDWYALLQMVTAHCHTSLRARVTTARKILECYEIEEGRGELQCPDQEKPDISMLQRSIEKGKRAVIRGEKGYTVE